MRILILVLFLIAIGIIVFKLNPAQLYSDEKKLTEELRELNQQFYELAQENESLKAQIEYLSYPENLEKELRSRFNYKSPGEKFIILTPAQNTESATSSP